MSEPTVPHPRQHRLVLSLTMTALALARLCRGQEPAPTPAPAHFHHVHLNVTHPDDSIRFYSRVFGAVPVKYEGVVDALFTGRSFLFLSRVETPPPSSLTSGIWHIGWGGVDVKSEFAWWQSHGVPIHTPLSPLPGADNYYFYISGPDRELIEINTMGHHRFGHVHLFATDVNATTRWYAEQLGLQPRRALPVPRPTGNVAALQNIWMNSFRCDDANLIVFGKPDQDPPPPWWPDPPLRTIAPTRGRAIDHLAFSYRGIDPVFARMKAAGVRIVEPIARRAPLTLRSFFVLAPDDVLVEIVEAPPLPDVLWEATAPRRIPE